MYTLEFKQSVKGSTSEVVKLYVPELEMALSLCGLLDRICKACPGEKMLFDLFNIYPVQDNEKK